MSKELGKRYEFVLFFEVENGNPNGDPDAGNMPRIDPETSHGLVTDVCLKRKVRNYIEIARSDVLGFDVYVREGVILNEQHKRAYLEVKPENEFIWDANKRPSLGKNKDEDTKKKALAIANSLRMFMCTNFYDIRTFGAVMSTDVNCGQVRGPVQMGFARSIDTIIPQDISITRVAVTKEEGGKKEGKDQEMGRKHIVPYGLYRAEGYVSASLAQKTGFSEEDLDLFWEALLNMFEHDHSAARGKMASRKLVIFEHESLLGNAPAHKLFDLIKVERKDCQKPPRAFSDYMINVDHGAKPNGITIIERE